jgi:hypothetical protein
MSVLLRGGGGGIVILLLIGRISLRNIGRDIAMLLDLLLLMMIREKSRFCLIVLIKMGDPWIGMGMFGNRVALGVGGAQVVLGVRVGG